MKEIINNPSFRIFSFYNKNVSPRVPEYQNAVFAYFGYRIEYITVDNFSHGDFLNYVAEKVTDVDFIIVFDVDCIPVKDGWVQKLLFDLAQPRSIAGAAQTANHLQDGKNLYISPFFFGISTTYLRELQYPDMRMTEETDAGQKLTDEVIKDGGKITYWWPTDIEEEKWSLYHPDHPKFGPGTTYNHFIYHAFFSRFDQSDRFIKKCKSVLGFWGKLRYIKLLRSVKKIKNLLK